MLRGENPAFSTAMGGYSGTADTDARWCLLKETHVGPQPLGRFTFPRKHLLAKEVPENFLIHTFVTMFRHPAGKI